MALSTGTHVFENKWRVHFVKVPLKCSVLINVLVLRHRHINGPFLQAVCAKDKHHQSQTAGKRAR